MSTPEDRAVTRAEPLPEERVAETGEEDRVAEASEILRDSEERVAEVLDGNAPADAADERRTSADTAVDP